MFPLEGETLGKPQACWLGPYRQACQVNKRKDQSGYSVSIEKLVLTKYGSCRVLQVRKPTITVDVNGTDNLVSTDHHTQANITKRAIHAIEVEQHGDVKLKADNTGDE